MRLIAWIFAVASLCAICAAILAILSLPDVTRKLRQAVGIGGSIQQIRAFQTPRLRADMAEAGLTFGAPVLMRIFKEERELEVWVKSGDAFDLFRTYAICNHSGDLGPKLREGDRQSPEGIYRVGLHSLNPNSSYHLSFNLGYPNPHDRAHGRTGSFLMVHGDCVSVGCYAMTDPAIEEIYVLAEAALRAGQPAFQVQAFPFRMNSARMLRAKGHRWETFWKDLKPIYDAFETHRTEPSVEVHGTRYRLAG